MTKTMIDRASCYDCGGFFDTNSWTILHKVDCPQNPKRNRGKIEVDKDKSLSDDLSQDKKWVFLQQWKIVYPDLYQSDVFQPVTEFQFAKEQLGRNWGFDWSWPDLKVAVEVDGGNRMVKYGKDGKPVAVGRHTTKSDYEKLNAAAALGWFVFRYTPEMLTDDPISCCEQVFRKLCLEVDR